MSYAVGHFYMMLNGNIAFISQKRANGALLGRLSGGVTSEWFANGVHLTNLKMNLAQLVTNIRECKVCQEFLASGAECDCRNEKPEEELGKLNIQIGDKVRAEGYVTAIVGSKIFVGKHEGETGYVLNRELVTKVTTRLQLKAGDEYEVNYGAGVFKYRVLHNHRGFMMVVNLNVAGADPTMVKWDTVNAAKFFRVVYRAQEPSK